MEVRKGGTENGGTACSLSARGQQDEEIKEQCMTKEAGRVRYQKVSTNNHNH